MKARELHARMKAAATAFKLAGGRNPRVTIDGERVEIVEANSTNSDEAARNQALIDQRLGDGRSTP